MQGTTLANGTARQTDWHSIDWKKSNRLVRNLRQRIFRATQAGDWKKVRSLQKLMLRSQANRVTSVRRVTQENKGKKTPGIDKVVVKTPAARTRLVDDLTNYQLWKAKPARRVYIPKANSKLRPLGIPVVTDRCIQAMVKNALEPSWEARFEGTSYGFRPGRGCHDAIQKIFLIASKGKKTWVVDADIKGAFDNIDHKFLLQTIGNIPARELIKQWLKAGYVDKNIFNETEAGTPQGGVISPVLANIALHGLEEALGIKNGKSNSKRLLVRYADDFAVFCESQEDAQQCRQILTEWLRGRGLELSSEKTKIVNIKDGFNFLGFNIRRYRSKTSRNGWKLLTKPSKESVQKHRKRLKEEWKAAKGQNILEVIRRFNPLIRGWANYFRAGVAKEVFKSLDHWMNRKEMLFARHAHPTKPHTWWKAKYFGRLNLNRKDKWVFGDKQTGNHLLKYNWFPIERHVMVKGTSSPDDHNLKEYWKMRNLRNAKDLPPSKQKIALKQKGICPQCRESLFNEEELHLHHKKPKHQGGKDEYSNLQLVHLYCHQQIHSKRGITIEHNETCS